MTVRPAQANETGLLARLHAECFEGAERWGEAAIAALLTMPGTFALLAAPARGMAMFRVAGDEAEILTLAVSLEQRRRGVGSALLGAGLSACMARGAREIFLEVARGNSPARMLYDGAGFETVALRPRYYADGADAEVLRLALG